MSTKNISLTKIRTVVQFVCYQLRRLPNERQSQHVDLDHEENENTGAITPCPSRMLGRSHPSRTEEIEGFMVGARRPICDAQ